MNFILVLKKVPLCNNQFHCTVEWGSIISFFIQQVFKGLCYKPCILLGNGEENATSTFNNSQSGERDGEMHLRNQ